MLITKHIMFVGFSLRDEAFNEIAATVRRSLKPTDAAAERGDAPRSIGTALTLSDRPVLSELWPDLECVAMIDGVKDEEDEEDEAVQGQRVLMSRGARARKLEVFLDRVCLEARQHATHSTCSPVLLYSEKPYERQTHRASLSR